MLQSTGQQSKIKKCSRYALIMPKSLKALFVQLNAL